VGPGYFFGHFLLRSLSLYSVSLCPLTHSKVFLAVLRLKRKDFCQTVVNSTADWWASPVGRYSSIAESPQCLRAS